VPVTASLTGRITAIPKTGGFLEKRQGRHVSRCRAAVSTLDDCQYHDKCSEGLHGASGLLCHGIKKPA
jgi:hypothetical protein